MRTVRLLPILLLAGAALLLFKSIGLLTNGGYVLTGIGTVMAAGGEAPAETGSEGDMTLPSEPTLVDDAPTLEDPDPTVGAADDGHGATTEEHGATTEEVAATADEGHTETAAAAEEGASDLGDACDLQPVGGEAPEGEEANALVETLAADCPLPADAVPMMEDGMGGFVPLTAESGASLTEAQLLERLGERRAELDAFSAELDIRSSLVEAAEKRIEERVGELESIEARINALVAEKKAIDEGQFKGLVSLYETMKPGDAAQIFDQLDMSVLLKVARSMNPKKLAPIMAKMDPQVAQILTVNLAVNEVEPTIDLAGEDMSALPQIVGQ